MPLPEHSKQSHLLLVLALVLLLGGGFVATSLVSYQASLKSIRSGIVNTELPLTSDMIYGEIQKILERPLLIASTMSHDTFVRDWVIRGEKGEKDVQPMARYLGEIQKQHGAYTSFFVSDRTLNHYQAKGVTRKMRRDELQDIWYFRVRDMKEPHEITVGIDPASPDRLNLFIKHKVFDFEGKYLGAAGVGLTVDTVVRLIDQHQRRFDRSVFFVDTTGRIVLTGTDGGPQGVRAGKSLAAVPGLGALQGRLIRPRTGKFEYREQGRNHFLNVRYIPELDWYLFVEKQDGGLLTGIRNTLYLNLLICLPVIVAVLVLTGRMIRGHRRDIAALAITDVLTGLPNRRGFELLAGQALQEARRDRQPLSALMLDLDHFKLLNNTYGHQAGDLVLQGFAEYLREGLRQSEIICRWGGDEFLILLKDTAEATAHQVAEKIRGSAGFQRFPFRGVNLHVTTSIGLAEMHPDDSLDSLVGRADRGLYRAKQSGRDCVCVEPSGNADVL